ncbi:MAG: electron transfer flavoprotein subunit alpha/FixB family protein [Dinghuibacter sp.]|nr:electron transfer flavoprotein subunit alpha/FixB family protein [Dinghuibacter sp.]
MSVLVYIDQADGQIKKSSLEALCYGAKVAELTGTHAEAVVLGPVSAPLSELGKYGARKVHHINHESFSGFDAQAQAKAVADVAQASGAGVIVCSFNVNGKAIAPRLSARLKAGLVAGAVALPVLDGGFTVRKSVFSGKAFANIKVNSAVKIVAINPNSYQVVATDGVAEVSETQTAAENAKVKITATNKITGEVPLAEAELVISGGRGLKGPENWGMVTDLAQLVGAATACSRAVADAHWRPHHEHVGQTGLAIAPNLYFAIGISGAIQHLAGVNRSKVIVVINKDPEAPFFKAADYGIVGDAFEVMPKIIDAVKKLKTGAA